MCALSAPGLYAQPMTPVRALGRLSRGDIAVFLGYARRGPVDLPVRVESLTMAEQIFGAGFDGSYLLASVKGFFENGGRTAYVIRLAPSSAKAAMAILPRSTFTGATSLPSGVAWVARASFGWSLVDPRERKREARPDEANWVQVIEEVFRQIGPRSPAPGTWANGYELRISRTQRARTETFPETLADPRALRLKSLAGLEAHSVLELSQTKAGVTRLATVATAGIDRLRQWVLLPQRLADLTGSDGAAAAFDPGLPIQVTSVEFDVEIWTMGRLEQAFRALSPDPRHAAPLAATLRTNSRSLSLELDGATSSVNWGDTATWPPEGNFTLSGGRDGLETIAVPDWLRGLGQIARLSEAALIAAPDLVLQPISLPASPPLPAETVDCCDLSPRSLGKFLVQLHGERADGTEGPLVGVSVDVLGSGGSLISDTAGLVRAEAVPEGLLTLRLAKDDYEPAEAVVQAERFLPTQPVPLTMTRILTPRPLDEDDMLDVLTALIDPQQVGPYKVVIVDPPRPEASLDQVRNWRARLPSSDRLGFFAPWLRLPSTDDRGQGGVLPCPPCGHVCGAFAQAEVTSGIHRTGANLPLRFAEGVMLEIDEASAGLLNPDGINAIRSFPGRGIRLFGTRTLSSDPEWRYLTARRVVDAVEKTLERGLQWMVFEPNNLMTRHAVAQTASALLNRIWRDGILAGSAPDEAYSVKCDLENNPVESREIGQLVLTVGVAPTTPYEFVLFRLGNEFDAVKVTEDMP